MHFNVYKFTLLGTQHSNHLTQQPVVRCMMSLQDANVVAVHCGEKGLAVCGVRADLRVKRPSRPYVVTGFEHITHTSFRGTHKLPVLAGMVQQSQVLDSVFAADPHSFVVGASGWVAACALA
jgi:hypothetical protein